MAIKNLENKEYTNSLTEEILEQFKQEESSLELHVKSWNNEMEENSEKRDNTNVDKNITLNNDEDMEEDDDIEFDEFAEMMSGNPKRLFKNLFSELKNKTFKYEEEITVWGTKFRNNQMYGEKQWSRRIIYIEYSKTKNGKIESLRFEYNDEDNTYEIYSDGKPIRFYKNPQGDKKEEVINHIKRAESRYNALNNALKSSWEKPKDRKKYDRKRRLFNI